MNKQFDFRGIYRQKRMDYLILLYPASNLNVWPEIFTFIDGDSLFMLSDVVYIG